VAAWVPVGEFIAGQDYPMFVVTAADRVTGARSGCLVGFATQCAIEPFRFLVCVSRSNHTHRIATDARFVAVHALSADQHDLAALFGGQTGDEVDKFAECDWTPGPDGVPVLTACSRRLVGTVLGRFDFGDHTGLLLAPVAEAGEAAPPLMFSMVRDIEAGHPA
jgi:flavin reductase (DIM6/NTAB) family NADH-FMN oxidoreductase RutF